MVCDRPTHDTPGEHVHPFAAAVALLAPFAAWVIRAAPVVGPVLAVGIVLMALPTDFDIASRATLAVRHLILVPITIAAVIAIGRRGLAIRTTRANSA